jgi:hypothetical protein
MSFFLLFKLLPRHLGILYGTKLIRMILPGVPIETIEASQDFVFSRN